jgi:hypothetical protein
MGPALQLFGDMIWLRSRTNRVLSQLEKILMSQADINSAAATFQALLTDIGTDVGEVLTAVTAIQTALASGQGVSTAALDAVVAQVAGVQSSLDSATSQVQGLVPPAAG